MADYFNHIKNVSQKRVVEIAKILRDRDFENRQSRDYSTKRNATDFVLGLRSGEISVRASNRNSSKQAVNVSRIFVESRILAAFELQFVGWVVNEGVSSCLTCNANFSTIRRRHHCRACGLLVCGECSKNRSWLEGLERIGRQRICIDCTRLSTRNNRVPLTDSSNWGNSVLSKQTGLDYLVAKQNGAVDEGGALNDREEHSKVTEVKGSNKQAAVKHLRASPGFVIKTKRLPTEQPHITTHPELLEPPSIRKAKVAWTAMQQQMKVFVNVLHHESVEDSELSLFPPGIDAETVLPQDSEYRSSSECSEEEYQHGETPTQLSKVSSLRLTTVVEERASQLLDEMDSSYGYSHGKPSPLGRGSGHGQKHLRAKVTESLLSAAANREHSESDTDMIVPVVYFGANGTVQVAEDKEGFPVHVYNVLISTEYFLLLQEQFRKSSNPLELSKISEANANALRGLESVKLPVTTAAAVEAAQAQQRRSASNGSMNHSFVLPDPADVNITDPRCINKILRLVNLQYSDHLNETQFVLPRVQCGFKGDTDRVLCEQEYVLNTHAVHASTPLPMLEQMRAAFKQQRELLRNSQNSDSPQVVELPEGGNKRKLGSLLVGKGKATKGFFSTTPPSGAASSSNGSHAHAMISRMGARRSSDLSSVASSAISDVTIASALSDEEKKYVRGSRRFQFFSSNNFGSLDVIPGGLTDEMLMLDMKQLVGRDLEAAIKEASCTNPSVLLGWQIMLFAGELGAHNVFVIIDIAKNNLRKTEYKISNKVHGDTWVKLRRSEKKTGVDFRLLRQVLYFQETS